MFGVVVTLLRKWCYWPVWPSMTTMECQDTVGSATMKVWSIATLLFCIVLQVDPILVQSIVTISPSSANLLLKVLVYIF